MPPSAHLVGRALIAGTGATSYPPYSAVCRVPRCPLGGSKGAREAPLVALAR